MELLLRSNVQGGGVELQQPAVQDDPEGIVHGHNAGWLEEIALAEDGTIRRIHLPR